MSADTTPLSSQQRAEAVGAEQGGSCTIPVAALVAEAVDDALAPFHVRVTDMPLDPTRVLELIETARR